MADVAVAKSPSFETKSRSKRYCSVPQCSTYGDEKNVSIHFFPKNDKLKKKWYEVLKMGKPLSKYMTVCSKHFTENDYYSVSLSTKKRRLKTTSIPSQNLPKSSILSHEKRDERRLLVRHLLPAKSLTVLQEIKHEGEKEIQVDNFEDSKSLHQEMDEHNTAEKKHCISCCCFNSLPTTSVSSVHVQTDNDEDKNSFNFCNILNDDKNVAPFTGVDLSVIDTIEKSALKVANYNGINFEQTSSCSRYFYSFLSLMSVALKPFIYWPTKDEIVNNMPKCFQLYRNTRIVLDCTEIAVEKCKCLSCRIVTYSHYKGTNTVKFMVGIAPSGLITYLSAAHGGRASDKSIFNKEKLVEKLDPFDGIMVDKGFMIETECEQNFLTLIRPPFLRKQSQFSKADAEQTANIARARVHVERAIERIKVFKIVKHQIPKYLLPHVNDIMKIIVALVNLSPPIFREDKFMMSETECETEK